MLYGRIFGDGCKDWSHIVNSSCCTDEFLLVSVNDTHPAHGGRTWAACRRTPERHKNPRVSDDWALVSSRVQGASVLETVISGSTLFFAWQGWMFCEVYFAVRLFVLAWSNSSGDSEMFSLAVETSWMKVPWAVFVVPAPDGVSSVKSKLSQHRWVTKLLFGLIVDAITLCRSTIALHTRSRCFGSVHFPFVTALQMSWAKKSPIFAYFQNYHYSQKASILEIPQGMKVAVHYHLRGSLLMGAMAFLQPQRTQFEWPFVK